jgi:hypothetical protein
MISITLLDGSTKEVSREEVRGVFAWRAPLTNPQLKSDGVIYHGGKLLPVFGPPAEASIGGVDERAWLLVCEKHVQVIRGLPTFSDDIELNIVPELKRAAPIFLAAPAEEHAILSAEAATRESTVSAPGRSEEEEEAQVLQELEELLRAS